MSVLIFVAKLLLTLYTLIAMLMIAAVLDEEMTEQ